LLPPTSVHNIFTSWLGAVNRKLKAKIIVGASAMRWSIWLTHNNIVFDKAAAPSYLQAIFRGTYWTWYWSLLQEEDRQMIMMGCRSIETTAMEIFARHRWRFSNRIAF
jgi:hypothetical protein